MNADEFRDYIWFYLLQIPVRKNLRYAVSMLEKDGFKFARLDESSFEGAEYI
jgi:hypothetical protein